MALFDSITRWFTWQLNALGEKAGQQHAVPSTAIVDGLRDTRVDGALQLSTVWACVERRATTVASLPIITYRTTPQGRRERADTTLLYSLLKDSPNGRMSPSEFWRAMMMNMDLRGNGYARVDRDAQSRAIALWPMPADQVQHVVKADGTVEYHYRLDQEVYVFPAANVLHLRGLGNGITGLSRLEFMRATTDELVKAQDTAAKVFGSGGKPTGALMVDQVLKPDQRAAIRQSFGDMAAGSSTGRLFVLEANMKYQQLSISPEDQQLLESRRYGVEEICRWFDVPPVLVHHSNVTTWGSGIEQIIDGFHKFTIRPLLVGIEQAIRKQVMTPEQRAVLHVEYNHDALLRGNARDRAELYSIMVQNGVMTRNEARRLENLPAVDGGDELTAQVNLAPLAALGATTDDTAQDN